jgi:hypothetical protein
MLLRVTRAIPHLPRRRLAGSATLRIPTQFANAIHEKTILLACILSSCSRRPRACRHRLRQRPVHPPGAPRGTRTRVIGRAALDLLLGQPDTASPYFFPADWGEGHLIGVVRVLDRLCASAKLDDMTPHTLRHTFASVAADLGFFRTDHCCPAGSYRRGTQARGRRGCPRDSRDPGSTRTGWLPFTFGASGRASRRQSRLVAMSPTWPDVSDGAPSGRKLRKGRRMPRHDSPMRMAGAARISVAAYSAVDAPVDRLRRLPPGCNSARRPGACGTGPSGARR